MSKNPIWISEDAAAEMMGLTKKYFRECVTGKNRKFFFGYVRVSGKVVRYNKNDIENYFKENAVLAL